MLQHIITSKKNQWLHSADCSIKSLVEYMRSTGGLRDTQIEAIEQYLFFKDQGREQALLAIVRRRFFSHRD